MDKTVTCDKCKESFEERWLKLELQTFKNGTQHQRGMCPKCGQYIKFVSFKGPLKFYFGKHKDKTVGEVGLEDPKYLDWVMKSDFKESFKQKIHDEMVMMDLI